MNGVCIPKGSSVKLYFKNFHIYLRSETIGHNDFVVVFVLVFSPTRLSSVIGVDDNSNKENPIIIGRKDIREDLFLTFFLVLLFYSLYK